MRYLVAFLSFVLISGHVAARPNIVVILTDDQEDTGSTAYMPKMLSLLAERGIVFVNSFVNVPLCAPSRSSFLTGQAAHNHGLKSNSPLDGGGWENFKEKETNALPVWLKAAGYKTALVGKYLNYYGLQSPFGAWLVSVGKYLNVDVNGIYSGNPRDWVPPGWSSWYSFAGTRPRYYDFSINDNGTILTFDHQPSDYSTDVLRNRAVRFILDQREAVEPFFLLIAPKAAHAEGKRAIPSPKYEQAFKDIALPISPAFNETNVKRKAFKPQPINDETKHGLELSYRAQLQSLQSVDDLVEAVVDALQKAGKLNNTVIIYTSDNGFLFGDHRLIGKAAAYDGSIRVPLVVRGPGIPEGETRRQLVNNLDVVATIVELAGANPGLPLDGRSFTPLFANANNPWRSALLIEGPISRFDDPAKRYVAIRTSTRKYVKYEGGFEELFDITADPHELENEIRKRSYANDLSALRRIHDTLKSCSGPGCWAP